MPTLPTTPPLPGTTLVNLLNSKLTAVDADVVEIQDGLTEKAPISNPTFTGSVTLPGNPTIPLHAVPKQYLDSLQAGIQVKQEVIAATTANITLSGAQTIDGVSVTAG